MDEVEVVNLAKASVQLVHHSNQPRAYRIPLQLGRAFGVTGEDELQRAFGREPRSQTVVTVANDRVRFVTDPNGTRAEAVWPSGQEQALRLITSYIARSADVLRLQDPLDGGGFEFVLVEPRNGSFNEVAKLVRDTTMRTDSPLVPEASDYSVGLIVERGGIRANISLGAIQPVELSRWGLDNPPEPYRETPMLLCDVAYVTGRSVRWQHFTRIESAREALEYALDVSGRFAAAVPVSNRGEAT